MEEKYYWNKKTEYLIQSRTKMWNDDYMEFLIKAVWKITEPVNIVDFGCGLGFLGSLIMPLLPEGSTYTGIDKGSKLLDEARSIFRGAPFRMYFIEEDLLAYEPSEKYDIAVCQSVLMHIPEPQTVLEKMRDSVVKGGRVICIEIDWNATNAALFIDGLDTNGFSNAGILQKLWNEDYKKKHVDRCIGIKIPVYMQKLGLMDVGVRLNDCVQFVNPEGNQEEHKKQLSCFLTAWGHDPGDRDAFIKSLCSRELSEEEAAHQYECECNMKDFIDKNGEIMSAVHAPSLFISYGTK